MQAPAGGNSSSVVVINGQVVHAVAARALNFNLGGDGTTSMAQKNKGSSRTGSESPSICEAGFE